MVKKTIPVRMPEEFAKAIEKMSREAMLPKAEVMRILGRKFIELDASIEKRTRVKFRR